MSGNHETIISAGNPVKRFPTGLQELYRSTANLSSKAYREEFKAADQENT